MKLKNYGNIIAVVVVVIMFLGLSISKDINLGSININTANAQSKIINTPVSVADLIETLQGAVVNISTKQTIEVANPVPLPNLPEGSPFNELFKDFFNDGKKKGRKRSVQSLGSGFIIGKQGYIVTNNHVIDEAEEIIVKLQDGTSYEAEIVGTDEKTDIAVLKIKAKQKLQQLKFGNSDKLRVGDWVVAIGNPFGLGGTLTLGIVSARNRDINSGPYDDYIQTDAAINRGNSGGPLFDMNGTIIGVNTAIFSPTGGSVGIGFAIPSNTVKKVVLQLIKYGETRRGWLGVRIQEVNEGIRESFGLEKAEGALIANVIKDSPAQEAKLSAGDIIIDFDGKKIKSVRDLPLIVAETPINTTVNVVVWRNNKTKTFRVTLGRLEEAEGKLKSKKPDEKLKKQKYKDAGELLGMNLIEVTKELRGEYSIDEDTKGLIILKVDQTGKAHERGIRAGFVITEIEGRKIATLKEANKIIDSAKKNNRKFVLLLILDNQKQTRFVPVEING